MKKNYFLLLAILFVSLNFYGQSQADIKKIIANYKYFETEKKLELNFKESNLILHTKSLPWKKMPLLQPLFHWSVDEIK